MDTAYSKYFNDHFFEGDQNVQQLVELLITDAEGRQQITAPFRTNGSDNIGLSILPLAAGALRIQVSIEGVPELIETPALLFPDRSTVTLEAIFTAAHNHTPAVGEERTEEAATATTGTVTLSGTPVDEIVDFDKITYGRTEKSQKDYYLERLTNAAAENLGQLYRVYKEDEESGEKEFLNPKGPVYRSVVKKYEIAQGLREA